MWSGRKRVVQARRSRRREMWAESASWPQPSQGRSVEGGMRENRRAREKKRQIGVHCGEGPKRGEPQDAGIKASATVEL